MRCINDTIVRMRKLRARLGCDHRAVFATTYLLLTEQVRDTMRRDPHFFKDPRWLIYEDTVFANFYFSSIKANERGKPVPPAWKIAFDTAAQRYVAWPADQPAQSGVGYFAYFTGPVALVKLGQDQHTPLTVIVPPRGYRRD